MLSISRLNLWLAIYMIYIVLRIYINIETHINIHIYIYIFAWRKVEFLVLSKGVALRKTLSS